MTDILLEKAAAQFRTENGINPLDNVRLNSLLQKLNVITVFKPLSENFSGMALKTETENGIFRFMLVNSSQSIGKQNFTICHELYHLYFQQDFTSMVCNVGLFDKKRDKNEYNADVFASYLLLPKEGLLNLISDKELEEKKISLSTIVFLEQLYQCSRSALLYRLKALGLLSKNEYDEFVKQVRKTALEHGYDTSLYRPGNTGMVIGDYGSSAKELFDRERISQSHYFSLLSDLGIDISEIENLKDGEE